MFRSTTSNITGLPLIPVSSVKRVEKVTGTSTENGYRKYAKLTFSFPVWLQKDQTERCERCSTWLWNQHSSWFQLLLQTRYFFILDLYFFILVRYFLILVRYFLILVRYFLILVRYLLILVRYFLILVRYFLILVRYFLILVSYFLIISLLQSCNIPFHLLLNLLQLVDRGRRRCRTTKDKYANAISYGK